MITPRPRSMNACSGFLLCALLVSLLLCADAAPPAEPAFESVYSDDYSDLLRSAEIALHDKANSNAFALQRRLACAGSQANQAALGGLYLTGRGVKEDDLTGYAWLKLSAASGVPEYRDLVHALEKQMTPQQRLVADAKAAALQLLYAPVPTHMSCMRADAVGSHLKVLTCDPESAPGGEVWLKRCAGEP